MLIVFSVIPVAAPLKVFLGEKLVAEVAFINLIVKLFCAVKVWFPCGRLDHLFLGTICILHHFMVRIVQCVDVNCHPQTML